MVTLQPDAYIRVQIAIIKNADQAPSPTPTASSSERSLEMEAEPKLPGIIDKLKKHEDLAAAKAKMFREQAAETPKRRWHSPMMCAALDVRKTVQAFGNVFRKCDVPEEYPGVKFSHSMMGSTIATRESLEI